MLFVFGFIKAFDTVDHDILLDKLYRNFGIRGKPLNLLTSYLKTDINILMYVNLCPHIPKYPAGYPRDLALGRYFFYYTLMTFR